MQEPKAVGKEELEHQRKLFTYFSSQDWPVLQDELKAYRDDVVRYLSNLDVSKEDQRIEHIIYKSKLDLLNMWIKLPDENKSFMQMMKETIALMFAN